MTVPTSILTECPMCKKETLHEILSGKIGGRALTVIESTVKCRECGHVHHTVIKAEKPVKLPVIVSWLKESKRSSISLGPDEVLAVEDEIMCGEEPVMVTAIESNGSRVKRAKARDIQTVWGKLFDKVRVPFSISHRSKTFSEDIFAVPDEEFFVGDILKVGRHDVVIHAIRIKERSIRTGGARARDIVRVYANIVRKTYY